MARKVKCSITGAEGRSDEFIKIGMRYYASQAIYDTDLMRKAKRKELVSFILDDLLGREEGQVFPKLLAQKLKEFAFYPDEVILRTLRECSASLSYQFNQGGKFDNENNRIFYLFGALKNHIDDVYRRYKRECAAERNAIRQSAEAPDDLDALAELGTHNNRQVNDLSQWIEEELE